ncbi:MAG: type II secretion system protein [Phycisphaerae bacterium]
MNGKSSRSQAFTLIELLVVVAIIALLISILLPSLSRAREEAKKVKCIAQLKEIGHAMHMYFMEHNEWFPFEKRNWPDPAWPNTPLHGFYYGGHPGRTPWWGRTNRNFRDTPAGRPFNQYLYPDLPHWDVLKRQQPTLWHDVRELPIYECPSDTGGFWNSQTDDLESEDPTYWGTGSSYDCNYHFVWNWAAAPGAPCKYLEIANNFLRKQRELYSSIFVMLFEDPFDSAQWNNIPRRGWHRQWSYHSFLFLDGHADNILADATLGNRGLGWKTAAGGGPSPFTPWWDDPSDPDYEFRNLGP